MRIQQIDPSAFTPPYDHALCRALAARGADVELITSEFLYGPVPEADGYEVSRDFYRRSAKRGLDARGRRLFKFAEHVPDMVRLRRELEADVIHYQWLTVPSIDTALLPPNRPRVMTAHYVLPPEPTSRQIRTAHRMFSKMDAVISHTEVGAERLRDVVGVEPERVHVIPHGAFDYLAELEDPQPLPLELKGAEGPVILFFGLLRPYKGVDVLIEAFSRLDEGAELWIVGNARMDLTDLMAAAEKAPGRVRWLPRFIEDNEIPAIMRRADVLTLPYKDAEMSGVLYAGLAFGKPMVLSDVGGFAEVVEKYEAAELVPPEDSEALAASLSRLVGDEAARAQLAGKATAAASGPFSWSTIAGQTLDLYREIGA